jgi:hypothetical protein
MSLDIFLYLIPSTALKIQVKIGDFIQFTIQNSFQYGRITGFFYFEKDLSQLCCEIQELQKENNEFIVLQTFKQISTSQISQKFFVSYFQSNISLFCNSQLQISNDGQSQKTKWYPPKHILPQISPTWKEQLLIPWIELNSDEFRAMKTVKNSPTVWNMIFKDLPQKLQNSHENIHLLSNISFHFLN